MPRVKALTKSQLVEQKMIEVSERCIAECALMGIKYKDIAEIVDVDPSAISHQMKNRCVTLKTYLAIQILKEGKNNGSSFLCSTNAVHSRN